MLLKHGILISLYSDNIDYENFEKLITTNTGESALPGRINHIGEPLVRMANSKIDIEYIKSKISDLKNDKWEDKLEQNVKNFVAKRRKAVE